VGLTVSSNVATVLVRIHTRLHVALSRSVFRAIWFVVERVAVVGLLGLIHVGS
jgi:hypothetical protein